MTNLGEYDAIKRRHTGNGMGRQGGKPRSSRALSWSQLEALPDPLYVIKGLVTRGALVEIYGAPGCGKSFFTGDMGFHVSLGRSWHKRRVNQGGVLYLAAEGGSNIKRRMTAFARHHRIDLGNVPFFVVVAPTNMLTPAGIAQVIADAASVPDLSMIIVDTAARVMPGGREDTEDMGKFVAACDQIRSKTGAAVVVVHHTGKNTSQGSRGSSTLPAAADDMIEVARDEKTKITIAEHIKARDGDTGARFGFRLLVVDLGIDDDADPVTSCIVEPIDVTEKISGPSLTADEAAYWRDITTYFARQESPLEQVTPELGSVSVRAATRDQIRDWLRHRGRFSVSFGVALSATDRTKLNRTLNRLRDKGKIGMTEQYLWLIHG